ncbi:hypothetical protein ACLOAV_006461 [Pseudogymnoascus australis]
MPLTLLTLPAEIRYMIWDYCLVSPTRRVLPVHYPNSSESSSPVRWEAPASPIYLMNGGPYDPSGTALGRIMHLVACAPTTATMLSSSFPPLCRSLPLVNRQLYSETSTRLWSANTLVLCDFAAGREVLAYLGKASLHVQRVELTIGSLRGRTQFDFMKDAVRELRRLVQGGSLKKLRLVYVDGGTCNQIAFGFWRRTLEINSKNWGPCEREVVWEEDKMKTDRLREVLATGWGLEGGLENRRAIDIITNEDWEPVKPKQLEMVTIDPPVGRRAGGDLRNDSE